MLHDISDAALAGLAVDPDNVALVFSAHVLGVDGKIGNCPVVGVLFLTPIHALCDSVLMRTAECGKNQCAAVRLTLVNVHSCHALVSLCDSGQIGEVQLGVNSVSEHIHCNCDDINVSCSFAVAEESTFNSVGTCKQTQLGIGNCTAAVIVGVERYDNIFTAVEVIAHIFDL